MKFTQLIRGYYSWVAWAEGKTIDGRYEIRDLLGEGAMGRVFRATHLELKREVAIKVLHPEYAVREDSRSRFVREARVAAALHHPNSITLIDFGEVDGALYIVMELLEGTLLRSLVDVHLPPFGLQRAFPLIRQMSSALAAAHRIHLVHRDIKPENIFLRTLEDGSEHFTLVDFGLAFIADRADDGVGRLTREGVLGGTPQYMSPEQAQGKAVGPASDIYSLGCLFFELLTTRTPFSGSVAELLTKHVYVSPPTLSKIAHNEKFSSHVEELVAQMLEKSAARRPSAEQVLRRVVELETGDERSQRLEYENWVPRRRRISQIDRKTHDVDAKALERIKVAVVPYLEELVVALAANTIDVVPIEEAEVVLLLEPSEREVSDFVHAGKEVVAAVAPGAVGEIAMLLRAGVTEIVPSPVRHTDAAMRIYRATQKRALFGSAGARGKNVV